MSVWTALAMTIGAALLINVIWRFIERYMSVQRVPRAYEEWVEDVRRTLFALVDADIDRGNLYAHLGALWGKQPPEYEGLAREQFARTLLINPALLAKAEEVGLVPPGTFAQLGQQAYATFDPTLERPPTSFAARDPRIVEAAREVSGRVHYIGAVAVSGDAPDGSG